MSCLPKILRLCLCLLLATATAAPLFAAEKRKPATIAKPKTPPAPKPSPTPLAPGELPLAARAAMLLEQDTGRVLYEKDSDSIQFPASATKILTALIVIESGDLERMVTIEADDTKVEPSALYIKPGEQFPREHLLFALLLKSANDVSLALARDNAGSVATFCEKMTRRAAELGATKSHFKNPHGLHDPHHFTTAHDLALIARAAMKNAVFRDIVATPEAWLLKGDQFVHLRNHNKLLWKMPGCTGIKTGYTVAAQQVLVSAARREGREVLSVILHSNKPGIWEDSTTLLLYGFDKLGIAPPPPTVPVIPAIPAASQK